MKVSILSGVGPSCATERTRYDSFVCRMLSAKMFTSICFAGTSTFAGQRVIETHSVLVCKHRRASSSYYVQRTRAAATDTDSSNPTVPGPTPAVEPEVTSPTPSESATQAVGVDSEKANPSESGFTDLVPGKIQLDEIALARQKNALDKYAAELRKKSEEEERERRRKFGWVPYAETLNGRLAMFFIITGLLTEYWTDYTIPEQVELMLRTLGIL